MGYELKMYVVTRHAQHLTIVNIKDNVYDCYYNYNGDKEKYIYYPTPNQSSIVPKNAKRINGRFCLVIGMIDLCNCADKFKNMSICKFEESDGCFIYSPDDGNKLVGLDNYGDYRRFVPIDNVLKELKDNEKDYQRFTIAIALLESIKKTFSEREDVGCLFYGH
jgi:hypothetical protein